MFYPRSATDSEFNMSDTTATQAPWTIERLLTWTRGHFQSKGLDEPRLAAELLLAQALGCRKIELYTRFDQVPAGPELDRFRQSVKAAAQGEPIAYLIGRKEFYSLDFEVTPDVLIPRPETELLIEESLVVCKALGVEQPAILDLCTGSGCIAVTLAKRLPAARITASDVSPGALAVAGRNAAKHGVESRIAFIESDMLDLPAGAIPSGGFDLIVSNPPYVSRDHPDGLADDVRKYEPALALFGGADGLDAYRRIAAGARAALKPTGRLLVEIGRGQMSAVVEILSRETGLAHLGTRRDGAGIDRALSFGPPP